jgi:hypothetical protein
MCFNPVKLIVVSVYFKNKKNAAKNINFAAFFKEI